MDALASLLRPLESRLGIMNSKRIKPNIIHITFDCVRPDHFGIAGYKKNVTPFLDSVARQGLRYKNAFSLGPGSSVSFVGMFTSTYPLDYGGYSYIDRPRVMLPEVLQQVGYATVGVHSSPYFSEYFGYNRGWNEFNFLSYFKHRGGQTSPGLRRGTVKSKILKDRTVAHKWLENHIPILAVFAKIVDRLLLTARKIGKDLLHYLPASFTAGETNNETAKVLDRMSGRPLYLWVHYLDAHMPYGLFNRSGRGLWNKIRFHTVEILAFFFAPFPSVNNFFVRFYEDMYDESLKYMDQNIAKLFDMLRERGILDHEAVVILHADHGEDFFEHGSLGHEQRLFNVNVRVPLIVYSPGRFTPATIEQPVSLIDVAPTILELADIQPPAVYRGKSLFAPDDRDVVIQASESAGNLTDNKFTGIAIISGGYKFVKWKEEKYLYALTDSAERDNLYNAHRDVADKLEAKAMAYAPKEPLR